MIWKPAWSIWEEEQPKAWMPFVVVIEPGARSVQTYKNVKRLAKDLGVSQVKVVANKVRNPGDEAFIMERFHRKIFWYDPLQYRLSTRPTGKISLDFSETVTGEIRKIKDKIDHSVMIKYRRYNSDFI